MVAYRNGIGSLAVATVGVYGIVALIVRMDDAGLKLISKTGGKRIGGWIGKVLVRSLWL